MQTHAITAGPVSVQFAVVAPATPGSRLVPLEWDSEHFGFPVARLDANGLGDAGLWAELSAARQAGVQLVVVTTVPERIVAPELLAEFQGALVDRKATFARSLTEESAAPAIDHGIFEYDAPTAGDTLVQLAQSAGECSRFRVDPRFPRQHFETMYHLWIERSVRREIAGTVLVVRDGEAPGGLNGFVTAGVTDGTGKIGLIAVAESSRGRGVGRRLVAAAHRWMRDHGARRAEVVTQRSNAPACALYERGGYSLARLEHYFHFWPLAE